MRDHIITSPHEVPHKSQSETNNIYIIHTYIYICVYIHIYIYNINRYDHHIYINLLATIQVYKTPYAKIHHFLLAKLHQRRPRPAFTAPEDVGPETLRTLRQLRPLIGGAVLTSALLGASSQMGWKSQETWRSW